MTRVMKPFIREILRDAAVLSGLIILPLAFLGPGWRPKDTDYDHGRAHGGRTGEPVSGEKSSDTSSTDRYIPILHAFPKEESKEK